MGSYYDDDNGYSSGSAYIFEKPSTGWANATETAKLTASDGATSDFFGISVSISDDYAIVGANGDDDNGSYSGSAYIFEKPSTGWANATETAKLTSSDGDDSDNFGWSVSISGEYALVGAYRDDDNGSYSGTAFIFEKPSTGWINATETAKLTASDGAPNDFLGRSVSISGDYAIVGAYLDDDNGSSSGSAYIFEKPSTGWVNTTETAKLTASDGAARDYFGNTVDISGGYAIIGAYGDDDNGSASGSAYVFEKPSTGWANATETTKLTAYDGAESDYFGYSVCISGEYAVVGAYQDDDNGESTGAAYFFALDTIAPVLEAQNLTVYLDETGLATISASDVVTSATDNHIIADTTLSQSSFTSSDLGQVTVNVILTDVAGNAGVKQITVTVDDIIAPVLAVQNATVYLDETGSATLDPSSVVTSATDNCTIADTTLSQSSFDCSDKGNVTIDVTLTDASGNTDVEQITVTIVDNIAPVLAVQNITVYLDETGSATLAPSAVVTSATDNCTITDTTLSQSSFDCSEIGDVTVDVTLTDASGNTDIEQITVTVADTISPVLAVQNTTVYLDETGSATLAPSVVVTSATDNCSVADTSFSQSSFSNSDLGDITVDVTLTDASGNTDVEQTTVTVADNIAPVLAVQNITVYLDETGSATIIPSEVVTSATDNCSVADTSLSQSSFSSSDLGDVTVDVTLTDASGNTAIEQITITVADNIAPVLAVQDVTVFLDETGSAILSPSAVVTSATDNCSISDTTLSQTGFNCSDIGTPVTVDVTLTDASGNTDIEQITVTVADNIAPVLAVQNITLYLDGNGTATLAPSDVVTSATDNCSVADTSLSQSSFDNSNYGLVTVDVTLTDASGNTTVEQITVTIAENIPPVLAVQNTTIYLDETGSATLFPSAVVTSATDNGTIVDTSLSQSTFDCSNLGDVTVDVTLSDASDNTDTKQITVTVVDTITPVLATQITTVYLDETGSATLNPSEIGTDNCSIADVTLSQSSFDCSETGDVTIDITLTDASGNTNSDQITVTIADTIAPVLVIQNTTVYLDETGSATITTSEVVTSATDNCSVSDTSLSQSSFSSSDMGEVTIDVTLTDAAGNSDIEQVTITVSDTISTGISDATIANLKVFPNPVTNNVFVEFEDSFSGIVTLHNIHGQTISTYELNNDKQLTIPAENLKNGVYMLHIVGNSYQKTIEIVKTN